MAGRFVRASSYRHVFGQPAKKGEGYENVKVSMSAWDTDLVSASARYIAVNAQAGGGGAFHVIPLDKTGRQSENVPTCRAHAAPVTDTAWSPHDDALVASAGEDGQIFLWRIDDDLFQQAYAKGDAGVDGVFSDCQDFTPIGSLGNGGRKVGQVAWVPSASNVLVSAHGDMTVKVWDVEKSQAMTTLAGHTEVIQSMALNSTGALLATTCRDRKFRLYDVRAGVDPIAVTAGHDGLKGARAVWCGQLDRIVTTGFSRASDRQVFLWDAGSLESGPIKKTNLDQSAGIIMPFWSQNGVLFLAGKGDGNIRYFEYEADELHPLAEYTSREAQRGMTFLPRRALNTHDNEVARAFKVVKNGVEPISFIVPRKDQSFQADIFPPAPSLSASASAAEFFSGKALHINYISLEDGSRTTEPRVPHETPQRSKVSQKAAQEQRTRTGSPTPQESQGGNGSPKNSSIKATSIKSTAVTAGSPTTSVHSGAASTAPSAHGSANARSLDTTTHAGSTQTPPLTATSAVDPSMESRIQETPVDIPQDLPATPQALLYPEDMPQTANSLTSVKEHSGMLGSNLTAASLSSFPTSPAIVRFDDDPSDLQKQVIDLQDELAQVRLQLHEARQAAQQLSRILDCN